MYNDKNYSVQSVDRTLDIIEALSLEPSGLSLTEISTKVKLHKSTVYRLVNTLYKRGFLNKSDSGNYRIGLKLIEIVSCYINSLELQTEARPYLQDITATLGLTSHLGILEGSDVIYIEKMDVFTGSQLYAQIGLRVPAFCSSLGKCLLSKYSSDELKNLFSKDVFPKYTENTTKNIFELQTNLTAVRRNGWAIDNEEYKTGHRCIAAPIYDYRGEIIAAISASGPTILLTDDRIQSTANYVINTANIISRKLGWN